MENHQKSKMHDYMVSWLCNRKNVVIMEVTKQPQTVNEGEKVQI